ncbi:hypothetical protein CDA63_11405 [Hymenobacter amundsenii]|uniref:Glycosyltransferase RgtA/B/C/D-like domain-containing protein n=1 Tax=Hymenobacter amundsenii TaxID=2006685 RepID=A0A246FN01_9BACT|nr:hypothetical protein [Hymenobacter amundsenii]OWP62983.1 hypothetical protein CDA63_11405 [Hymenobacter amundsenii]
MKTRYLLPLLVLFVALDLAYTGWENYQMPLDGDLARIVLPAPECRPVLSDPFGWAVLTRHAVYVAPNRFFAHAAMVAYFKSVPFGLQRLMSPISSVYAACGLFSALVQALLLFVLGLYASGSARLGRRFWLVVALLVPLFQSAGYHNQMGIIDNAVTYTFFYAFPLALLLLFYWPFYQAARGAARFRPRWWQYGLLLALALLLSFNGPIIPGVVAVLNTGICLYWLARQWQATGGNIAAVGQRVPWPAFSLLLLFGGLCLYSLYIGQFELESRDITIPLAERYRRLPTGLNETFFRRPALAIVLGAVLLNTLLIGRVLPATAEGRRLRRLLGWLGLFAAAYMLLLPLGGYREYRPFIIRRDSIMPVLLGLMALYAATTYYVAAHLAGRARGWYLGWVGALCLFYTVSDNIWRYPTNACQRQALETLAQARTPTVQLPESCPVLAWQPITNYAESEVQAHLLDYWGITWGKRLFQQPPGQGADSR